MYRNLSSTMNQPVLELFSIQRSDKYQVKKVDVTGFRNGSVFADMEVISSLNDSKNKEFASTSIQNILNENLYSPEQKTLNGIAIANFSFKESPPSPLNLKSVEIKATSVSLSWEPPKYHQVYSITGYRLQQRKVGRMQWVRGPVANQYTGKVEDLQPDTDYEVMVAARNEYGEMGSEIISVKTKADMTAIIVISVVIPVVLLVVLIIGFLVCWRQRRKRLQIEEQLALEQINRNDLAKVKAMEMTEYLHFSPETIVGLENELFAKKWKEIPRDCVEFIGELGSGAFGEVKKGKLISEEKSSYCAIKMLKAQATQIELRDLVNELNIMASVGEHPNIVHLIGACSIDGPLWLILRLAENGSLINYLQSHRPEDFHEYEDDIDSAANVGIPCMEKIKFALGIAKGMNHLAEKRCVHRDLAARNVLLDLYNNPMVSDFGLSRDVYESGQYEKTSMGKLPVKWMAMESLDDMIFTVKSDVYRIMEDCWKENPKDRPTFSELVERLTHLLEIYAEYLIIQSTKESNEENQESLS